MGIGTFVSAMIGLKFQDLSFFPLDDGENLFWFYLLHGAPIIPCLIRFTNLLLIFRKDTPKYYILRQDCECAKQVLKEVYLDEYCEKHFKEQLADTLSLNGHKLDLGETFRFLWHPLLLSVLICFFNIYAGSVAGEKYSNVTLIPAVESKTFTHNFYHVCKNVVFIIVSGCTGVLLVFVGRKPLLIIG
jgi:hypothetical protein